MRSPSVFEDLGCDFSRLERPGYWQNRRGFAFSPHELQANAEERQRWKLDLIERQVECEECGLGGSQVHKIIGTKSCRVLARLYQHCVVEVSGRCLAG